MDKCNNFFAPEKTGTWKHKHEDIRKRDSDNVIPEYVRYARLNGESALMFNRSDIQFALDKAMAQFVVNTHVGADPRISNSLTLIKGTMTRPPTLSRQILFGSWSGHCLKATTDTTPMDNPDILVTTEFISTDVEHSRLL